MNLSDTQLFHGIEEQDIHSLLQCLAAEEKTYRKGEIILAEGNCTENIGLVLSGRTIVYQTKSRIGISSRQTIVFLIGTLR